MSQLEKLPMNGRCHGSGCRDDPLEGVVLPAFSMLSLFSSKREVTHPVCLVLFQVDVLVRRGRVKVDGTVVKSPKMKLPVDCVIEVRFEVTLVFAALLRAGEGGAWLGTVKDPLPQSMF